jgi:hypothetical protein
VLFREAQHFLCHFREIGILEHQAAEGIAATGIKPGGDDNQVYGELSLDLLKGFGPDRHIGIF